MSIAELILPAIRWNVEHGFERERPAIDQAIELGVGGFIIFGGPAEEVRALCGELRRRAGIPLLIGADLERGAGQQFAGATGLPPLAALGALRDERAVRAAAALTAREARSIGINWVFGPVCDLDILPENPIVGTRAFGGEPQRVGEMALAWIRACQDQRVLACAKHFPGHGRTTVDSHATLPMVDASRELLSATDLVPFRAAVNAEVASIMSAHVSYPALDPGGAPATLSPAILTKLLRDEMGFRGLVVTDALIMEGVRTGLPAEEAEGEVAVRAIQAGCDVLCYPTDPERVVSALEQAVKSGPLSVERVDQSLSRRTHWARWADVGMEDQQHVELGDEKARRFAEEVAGRTIVLCRGERAVLKTPVDVIVVDDDVGGPYPPPSREPFFETLRRGGLQVRRVEEPSADATSPVVIALFGDIRAWKGRAGYSAESREAVNRACAAARARRREPIVVQFSHIRLAAEVPGASTLVCAWGGERAMQEAAARRLVAGL